MSRVFLLSASNISYTAPVTLAVRGFARPRTVPLLELAGRDGAVVPARATLAPRRGVLEGTLRRESFAGVHTQLDGLLNVLRDAPLQLSYQPLTPFVINPGFETGTTAGWSFTLGGGTFSVISGGRSGLHSLSFSPVGQTGTARAVVNATLVTPCASGDAFRLSLWIRGVGAGPFNRVSPMVRFLRIDGTPLFVPSGVWYIPTTTWTQISTPVAIAPADVRFVGFITDIENTAGVSGAVEFDDFDVRPLIYDRYLTVYPEDVDDSGTQWPSWINVRVPLVAPDPHWHAHAQSLPNLAAASQVISNAGNANVEPVIRVVGGTGGASAISVTNATTGQTASFSGTLGVNQVLLIDCARRTATRDGIGVLTLMNQAFRTGGLRLNPGANTIQRAFTGATTTFRLEYRERWH